MTIRRIDELQLGGKRVFLRVDFNVPMDAALAITDDTRIRAALPSIRHALGAGARLVLASHLGRPKEGKRDAKTSLAGVAARLAELLAEPVRMAPDCVGDEVEALVAGLKEGEVVLLENVRYHKEEEKNDPAFSRMLARLADVYVNDAFGTAHRAHGSTAGIASFVKDVAAGFLMMKEIEALGRIIRDPERPFVAILGGAKVSDKIGVLENLVSKVDRLLIGGAMAYPFLRAEGVAVGSSFVEAQGIEAAARIGKEAKAKNVRLVTPSDHVVARSLDEGAEAKTLADRAIPDGWMGVDIGPATLAAFGREIGGAKTIFWNGPVGVFEKAPYAAGTIGIANAVAASTAFSVVGGGDSVAAVTKAGVEDRISHLSTGGGASLEFVEGRTLPGIAALDR